MFSLATFSRPTQSRQRQKFTYIDFVKIKIFDVNLEVFVVRIAVIKYDCLVPFKVLDLCLEQLVGLFLSSDLDHGIEFPFLFSSCGTCCYYEQKATEQWHT